MIRVFFQNLTPGGKVARPGLPEAVMVLEGHAGFGAEGSDIVCAGVSAVVQTALAGITGVALIPQRVRQEKGFLETRIETGGRMPGELEKLEVILHTMLLGLREIEKAYPGSVEMVFDGK
ncbi:MAG TPA: ribosomal-processing cysteine protease Prp [Spirochaetes bacterium]|nr:ribosomal-processing cysteine protease Prp [Spirochaetota bacterium]